MQNQKQEGFTQHTAMRRALGGAVLAKLDSGKKLSALDMSVANSFKRGTGAIRRNRGWSVSR